MVIKLVDADFSADNIGQIDITEISDFTKAAILASGNFQMTEEQKSALEKFFIAVGAKNNTGVWTKLNKVYIPFLADDLSHAMVNYKGNAVDVTLSSSIFELRNKGVAGITTQNTSSGAKIPMILNSKNISVFLMYPSGEDYSVSGGNVNLFSYNGNSGNNRTIVSSSFSGGGELQLNRGFINPSGISGGMYGNGQRSDNVYKKLFGFSGNVNSGVGLLIDGTFSEKTLTGIDTVGTDTENRNLMAFSDYSGYANKASNGSCAAFLLGSAMTQQEMTILKTAMDTLASKFM